jgi:hypothetical protein
MVKTFIRGDESYPLFSQAKTALYEGIESHPFLSDLPRRVQQYARKFSAGPSISEKDVKRYLAFVIFNSHSGDIEDFVLKSSMDGLPELVYWDMTLFSSRTR